MDQLAQLQETQISFQSAGSPPNRPILDIIRIISEQHLLNQKHHHICKNPHHICKHLRKKLNILSYLFSQNLLKFLRQPLFSTCSSPPVQNQMLGERRMNEMKSLFDKKKGDLSIYNLPHTHIYIYKYLHPFYLYISLTILPYIDNFVHLEFYLLLLISTLATSRYQSKGSISICTNKYPGQR